MLFVGPADNAKMNPWRRELRATEWVENSFLARMSCAPPLSSTKKEKEDGMSRERESAAEEVLTVSVNFKRSTFDRISEAAAILGLTPQEYIGVGAVAAAKEDIQRGDRLRDADAEKTEGR